MENNNVPVQKIEKCRVCDNHDLIPIIDIGKQYLSSVFPTNLEYRDSVPKWPLDMVMCQKKDDTTCGSVQLAHRLDLTSMYNDYPYTSSTNSSMAGILKDIVNSARDLNNLNPGDIILDIGGNDGTLLSFFKDEPYKLINIDPAKNVKPLFQSANYTYISNFFGETAFQSVADKKAKMIFSIAMFYHLDNPMAFSREVAHCLDNDGVWIIQMAYLPAMIRTNMYDNIVHEHAGYYATHHVKWMMDKIGLEIFDVMENDVYGGSFRLFIKKKSCSRYPLTERYRNILAQELSEKIFDTETYYSFMKRIEKTRDDLTSLCRKIKEEGKTIWIYGASTKGNTILQYCGLGREYFVAAADSNPFKWNKYIIGSDIPITDESSMRKAEPNYLLALPYSFVNAFKQREAELVSHGTKFIVPLPEVTII